MKSLISKILAVCILVSFVNANDLQVIDFTKAKELFETKKALFIDARAEKLFKRGTILGSLNVTVKEFKSKEGFLPQDKNAKIVSYCNGIKCEMSDELAVLLKNAGYTNVVVFKGGYPKWKEMQMPSMVLKVDEKKEEVQVQAKGKKYEAKGATIYLGQDKGMIDQYWFEKVVLNDLPKNVQLVDVRKVEDFKEGHIKGAINAPLNDKKEIIDMTKLSANKLYVLYCNTGMQSAEVALGLKDRVGKDVFYFDANIDCKANECKVEANEDL